MKKESKYAIFEYHDTDSEIIEELSNYLDEHIQDILTFFEIPELDEKATVRIVPTKKEFDKLFIQAYPWAEKCGVNIMKMSRGFCENGIINYLSIKDYKSTPRAFTAEQYPKVLLNFKKTFMHEFVHYVNHLFNKINNCGRTEHYLKEGVATVLSGQIDDQKQEFNYSIDEILAKDGNECYNGWFLVSKYLIENYDKKFILQLFQSNREAREFLVEELYDKAKKFYNTDLENIGRSEIYNPEF